LRNEVRSPILEPMEDSGGTSSIELVAALSIGVGASALLGWWWADPVTALVIAAVALKEGGEAWKGEGCDCCHPSSLTRRHGDTEQHWARPRGFETVARVVGVSRKCHSKLRKRRELGSCARAR
jgi:hypothetical protein